VLYCEGVCWGKVGGKVSEACFFERAVCSCCERVLYCEGCCIVRECVGERLGGKLM